MFTDVVAQISPIQQVHEEIEVGVVLKSVVHVNQESVFNFRQDLTLIEDRFNAPLGDNSCFAHLFHRKRLFTLLLSHPPHFAESSFSDAVLVIETVFSDI